ncbi:helix-turn-helix transcriptional regulator [Amnibacterium setariae]|uniref:LuxR family transcriptional regulator n=1 Tax=Amnibacterium setariae TaxID=2306585 RepID=A0A3A1TTF3_9MICO|nr:LuxR C-terminal-related transcriptional regulator [Amnibacterium setariae]RIX26633.1 LuxR family transcriptional regulator [Amnibacterium setariae]
MPEDTAPLVGRAAALEQVVRLARRGTGSVLTGPPGSGGSRMLREVRRALLAAPGEVVLITATGASDDASRALGARGDGRPLRALLIEDAHRLDPETGERVIALALAGTAVVANATGPGGMTDALRRIIDEDRAVSAPLAPLAPEEVAELAAAILEDPVDAVLTDALTTASEGRPGTLHEIVEDGTASGAIVHADGLWRLVAPLPAARSVRSAVLAAFGALPPEQRGWIAAVAVAGAIADDLAPRIAAPRTIAAAAEARWTAHDPERLVRRIRSVPTRTAVLGTLTPRARDSVLRRLADVADQAARPLQEDERTALLRWRIELGDPVDAAEAFALALLPDQDHDAREELLRAAVAGGAPAGAALAEHLRVTRRPGEAARLIRSALPDAATHAERVALLRVQSLTTGVVERRSGDALRVLDEALAAGSYRDLLAVRAALLIMEARPREAIEVAEVVLASGPEAGFAGPFALLQRTMGLRELGRLDAALAAATSYALAERRRDDVLSGAALGSWLSSEIAVAVGLDLPRADTALAVEYASVPPALRAARRPPLAYTLGTIRVHRADPGSAVKLLREADAGSGSWREGWQPRILSELTIAQALAGDLDEAGATLERLRRIVCPPIQRARVELAAAQLAAARGDATAAAATAAAVVDRGVREGLVLDAFDAAYAGVRYGDPQAPARLLALGGAPPGPGRAAQRAYAQALASEDPLAVDEAATGLWAVGLRLHAIEAAARAAELGAPDAAPRLVAWLARSTGLRIPGVTDRRGGVALTRREREVARLAATGISDRAIAAELGITLRTAQTHLGRAFAKLGVHRRTQLRDLVGEP